MSGKIRNPDTGRYIDINGNTAKNIWKNYKNKLIKLDSATIKLFEETYSNTLFCDHCKIKSADDENFKNINSFIREGYSKEITEKIEDITNINEYQSMINIKIKLDAIMKKYNIIDEELFSELSSMLIPPGLKAVIRGNNFNREIFNIITEILGSNERFTCQTEVKVPYLSEKVDFYIKDNLNNKILLGFNQIDLWSGGQQTNRGDKYIISDSIYENLPDNVRLVCIVNKYVGVKSSKNKAFNIFRMGISSGRLYYPNHLLKLLNDFKE